MKCNGKTMDVIAKELQDFFPASDLETKPSRHLDWKNQFVMLTYVTNRAIQSRLDKVCGPGNWQNKFSIWGDKGVLCTIAVRFVDDGGGEVWVHKQDGADRTAVEATKGGFSGAMKRAACQWGIGRYLYEFPEMYAPSEKSQQGKNYVKRGWVPNFPKQFLPSEDKSEGIVEDRMHADAPQKMETIAVIKPEGTATEHFSNLPPASESGDPIINPDTGIRGMPEFKFPVWDMGLAEDADSPPEWIAKEIRFGKFKGNPWSYMCFGNEQNGWMPPDGPKSGRWSWMVWMLQQNFDPKGWKSRQAICSILHKLEKGSWLTTPGQAMSWALHCHEKAWKEQA